MGSTGFMALNLGLGCEARRVRGARHDVAPKPELLILKAASNGQAVGYGVIKMNIDTDTSIPLRVSSSAAA